MNTLDLAKKLARKGWKIFPCNKGKQPLTLHGFKDASSNPEIIQRWFSNDPLRLVGIPCKPNGFFALDIDKREGIDGFQALEKICPVADLVVATGPMQSTPRGGRHLLFTYPDDFEIPNNTSQLGYGLDLRSTGYICSGPGYSWLYGHEPETEIKPAPSKLLDAIRDLVRPIGKNTPQVNDDPVPAGDIARRLFKKYLSFAIPGNRNQAAFKMGLQLYYAGISQTEAAAMAREFARNCPQPKGAPFTEGEAVRAVIGAYQAGWQKRAPWKFYAREGGAA